MLRSIQWLWLNEILIFIDEKPKILTILVWSRQKKPKTEGYTITTAGYGTWCQRRLQ